MRIILPIVTAILAFSSCASRTEQEMGRNTGDTLTELNRFRPVDQTSVQLTWDTATYDLNSIDSYLWDDQLKVVFLDTGHILNGIVLDLQGNTKNPNVIDVSEDGIPTDCLYVAQSFKLIRQATHLNSERYKKGDSIYGSIDLLLLGKKEIVREPLVPFIDNRKWDTVRLKGSFTGRVN